MTWALVIPAGTRCKRITEGATAGRYWIDDLSWINKETHGFMLHDATHYGIDISADEVEPIGGAPPSPPAPRRILDCAADRRALAETSGGARWR